MATDLKPQTGKNDAQRTITHPQYATWQSTWTKLHDVYEGAGGFLTDDKPYLYAHPREWLDHSIKDTTTGTWSPNPSPSRPSPKLLARRKLARYENISEAVLSAVLSPLFSEAPTRVVGKGVNTGAPLPIEQWWKDVDDCGTAIDAALMQSWLPSAVFGHTLLLLDKAPTEPTTAADADLPVLRRYTPLDVIDWLTDENGELTKVKLIESAPRADFVRVKPNDIRIRVVDEVSWALYDYAGRRIDGADHGFGRLPVVVLYGKRRATIPLIGKSILGDPMLFIDAYNLISEERELLRNQTFAILNVPLGKDGDVETEQARIGSQSGTANVLFSGEAAQFLSPPGDNVAAYQSHAEKLNRMIYRLAAVPWEGDSRDMQSADALRLKRSELQATLAKYSQEVARVDTLLVELFYRAQYGAEAWRAALERDQVTVTYPRTFDPPDLKAVAENVGALLGLDLGETATKQMKKQTARVALPDADTDTMAAIDGEIDAQTVLTADEKRQQMLDAASARLAQAPRMAGGRPMPQDAQNTGA